MTQEVSFRFATFITEQQALKGILWVGRARDNIANIDCYCLATSRNEAEKWAKQKAWQMYDSRLGRINLGDY